MTPHPRQIRGAASPRRLVFQPEAGRAMQYGINQMANLVRPTYGPLPGMVASDRSFLNKPPELIDSGGTLVRRVPQIADYHANLGAMLVRDALKHLQDQVGDGTTLAALILQTVFNEGLRAITAGCSAMLLRGHLEDALRLADAELERQTRPIEGEADLTRLAHTTGGDPELAALLGEIFEIIGPYGRLEIRAGHGLTCEREYVEGMYWEDGLLARELITDPHRLSTELQDAAVLISNLEIASAEDMGHVLNLALQNGFGGLLLVTRGITGAALATLLLPKNRALLRVAAIKTFDTIGKAPLQMLEDLAVLTGGRPLLQEAGDRLTGVRLEDLGRARRAWADLHTFGVMGGKGSPRALRDHLARLREAHAETRLGDDRHKIQQRIGKLMGGTATLWVGAANAAQVDDRLALAERVSEALRAALFSGTLPGSGAALLACQPVLQSPLQDAARMPIEQRAAYRILLRALEEPLRVLAASANQNPAQVIQAVRQAPAGWGFDALTRRVVDLHSAGILDPAAVIRAALRSAVTTAALALTTDVIVHKARPEYRIDQD